MSDDQVDEGASDAKPFVVDHIIVTCNGCRHGRKIFIDPPFRSAQEFIDWEKTKPVPACGCGHPTAEFKLHIVDQN